MALFKKNETKNVSSTKGVKGGYIFVAPAGTTLPTDIKTNLAEAFLNLGFISEDGYTESEETDANELKDMNGDLMDSATTSRVESAKLTLAESKAQTLKVMYGAENAMALSPASTTATRTRRGRSCANACSRTVAAGARSCPPPSYPSLTTSSSR